MSAANKFWRPWRTSPGSAQRRLRRTLYAAAALGLLVAGFLFFTHPSSPAGRYVADPRIAVVGDAYWEMADGKWALVYRGGREKTFGTYARRGEGWVLFNRAGPDGTGDGFKIECSWFGLRLIDSNGDQVAYLRRRIVPFLRPDWVPGWFQ